jgi:hypothetical protein
MAQVVETVARKCMRRECLVNAAAAIGLVGSGALIALGGISAALWLFGKFLWVW